MTDDTVRVGVLSLHNSKESKAICNAVEDLGHRPEWLREENTSVHVRDGEVTLDPAVDVVANRMLLSNTDQPCEELGIANTVASIVPTLNEPAATLRASHKIASAAALAEADVPVPEALLALSSDRLNEAREGFGEEAVYKTAIGTHGGGTWKVGAGEPVNAKVGGRYAFLQQLVDHPGEPRDIRVYVVGDEVVGAMYRYAPENDWRTNVALGGSVEDATDDISPEIREMAREAASVVGLDYAGVDIVESVDQGPLVLEVNPTAGFKGLYEATDRSPAPLIARQAIERAGGTVDDERVRELTATLDDSVPSCKPRTDRVSDGKPVVVGYIEEVVVSGTSGTTTVLAKSDTGATRTSIDTRLAAEIGAGPIKSITKVKSGSVKSGKSRPVVDLVVGVGGTQHTVTASIEDRSHMDYPMLLGRDILEHYQVDVRKRADADEPESEEEAEE